MAPSIQEIRSIRPSTIGRHDLRIKHMSDYDSLLADALADEQEAQLEQQEYNDSQSVWECPNE